MANTLPVKGSVAKMAVNFRYPDDASLTLDDIDFYVEYYFIPSSRLHFPKEAVYREETTVEETTTVEWFAYVDTGAIKGSGDLIMELTAFIPDSNLPSHTRKETARYNTSEKFYI